MKTKNNFFISIIAIMLSCVIMFTAIAVYGNANKGGTVSASTRTVELSESTYDAQSILNEFDDAVLTTEGTTTYFEGFKSLDLNAVSEIDYISEVDYETLSECTVKYNFSYDYESNVVTIAASATLPDGSIEIDEIRGVGFINDDGEIDAVMNVDGEGVLLSEMRDVGMIENCGWFSKLIKAVAKAVAVAAVAVVAVAAVVVTAGVAAPAVVGAGVATASIITSTALSIAATSLSIAAIAAGVAITTSVVEFVFEGIQYKLQELNDDLRYELQNGLYYLAVARTDTGAMLVSTVSVTISVAAKAMKSGLSCYNYYWTGAYEAAKLASDGLTPVHDDAHKVGYFNHYHRFGRKGAAHAFYGAPQF